MKILVAGDYCLYNTDLSGCKSGKNNPLSHIAEYTKKANYSIVNFETATRSEDDKPIRKEGPNLSSDTFSIELLKDNGFDCITLANNHSNDYGGKSLMDTIGLAKSHGLDTVGAGENLQDASNTLYKTIDGETLAIINCCETEYTIASNRDPGANPLSPIDQYYKIIEARQNADYVIVIVHGGHENYQLPSPRMQKTYRFFIDAGADAVVNHHQHCPCGFEVYKDKTIFYGLGNFLFPWNNVVNKKWNYGYMVMIDFEGNKVDYQIIPYEQSNPELAVIPLADPAPFLEEISKLNETIADPEQLIRSHDEWMDNNSSFLKHTWSYFISNRYLGRLYRRGLIPQKFIEKELTARLTAKLNLIRCESHLERTIRFFEKKLKNQD